MVRCGVLAVPSREEAQRHTGQGWEQLDVPPEELEEVATADTRPGWATENVDRWKCRPQRCIQSERSRQFSLDSNRECATLSLNMHQLCKMISRPTNKDLSRRRKLPSSTLQSNPSTVWLIWKKWKCEHSQALNVFSLILDILHSETVNGIFHRGDTWLKMHENWVSAPSWHDEPQLGALLYIPDVFIRISDLHVALCMYFSWSHKFASGYVEVPLRMGSSAWQPLC